MNKELIMIALYHFMMNADFEDQIEILKKCGKNIPLDEHEF